MAIDIRLGHSDHKGIYEALSLAKRSPPKPTNYCVGAVLVDKSLNHILATGYTLELEGNTHAEQCCFIKFANIHGVRDYDIGNVLPHRPVLNTSIEPCNQRSADNSPYVDRILGTQ